MDSKKPVDAVITWVDGYDAAHREKLAAYLQKLGITRSEAAAPTRYNQQGEITFCVSSILKHAPFIRTIYIVTDGQKPAVFDALQASRYADKINIVDHRHIFRGYEAYLPTFNSLTIATMLWRIEGLAEEFICFCDDFSIIRPVCYEDFFRDGKIVLRGDWKTHHEQYWHRQWLRRFEKYLPFALGKKELSEHREVQENAARLLDYNKRLFYVPHVPFPLKKDMLAHYFEEHPEQLLKNISHPLRNRSQFEIITLAYHLAISAGQAVIDNAYQEVTINPAHHAWGKVQQKLKFADEHEEVKFFCLQSLDGAQEGPRKYLLDWLYKHTALPDLFFKEV
ncbi:Stealth CR1 domain-containing protein [Legionella septentrionalis]|uniref:Stealth CR1 domain-containing protein n=1 Tax=Legionella septentrionalis TaxID=2498109 RepID=UPI000F8C794C|nr:Stealth CR1 domain-containing protein [Legionella septentrionalis]RUR12930.1 capsular biosynthesis protein [Legionella septentrionalis]